jgi:hypothetical protein
MPNQFGIETPQEAVQRVRDQFRQNQQDFANSNLSNNKYALAGQSLANIFGGTIKKTLDTRAARKSAAGRLAKEHGISQQEARAMAKEQVPREFHEVRRAKQMKAASGVAEDTYARLQPVIGGQRAQAASMTVMASQLRIQGFPTEATNMTLQAEDILKAEDARELGVKQAKATFDKTEEGIASSKANREHLGVQSIEDLASSEEILRAKIDDSDDPNEIEGLHRQLSAVQGRISKLNFISYSDADYERLLSSGAESKMRLEQLDDVMLDERLGSIEDLLIESDGKLASTGLGRLGAGSAQFLENYLGVDPGTYGADTLIADVSELKGSAAFVSAAIRHALTGAAMSAQEAPLLEPFLATPGESLSAQLAKVRVIRAYTQLDIETRQRFMDSPGVGRQWLKAEQKRAEAAQKAPANQGAVDVAVSDTLTNVDNILKARSGNTQ